MTYIPTNWQNGITPLNAENLNHIEEGVVANDAKITNVNNKANVNSTQIIDLAAKVAALTPEDEIVSGYVSRTMVNPPSGNYENDITAMIFEDSDLTTPLITKADCIYIDKFTDELFKSKIAGTNQLTPVNCSLNSYYRSIINDLKATKASIQYVDQKFNGAAKAVSFANYETMISDINDFDEDEYNIGQDILVNTLNVPDLWVYEIADESIEYTYVDDATFISALETYGYVQVGYYKLAALETQKVDLTDYQTKLTTTSVEDGTIEKTIGFDNQGNLVKGSAGGTSNTVTLDTTTQTFTGNKELNLNSGNNLTIGGNTNNVIIKNGGTYPFIINGVNGSFTFYPTQSKIFINDNYTATFQKKSGTLALTDDIPKLYKHLIEDLIPGNSPIYIITKRSTTYSTISDILNDSSLINIINGDNSFVSNKFNCMFNTDGTDLKVFYYDINGTLQTMTYSGSFVDTMTEL